jgi:hypothetical protein
MTHLSSLRSVGRHVRVGFIMRLDFTHIVGIITFPRRGLYGTCYRNGTMNFNAQTNISRVTGRIQIVQHYTINNRGREEHCWKWSYEDINQANLISIIWKRYCDNQRVLEYCKENNIEVYGGYDVKH